MRTLAKRAGLAVAAIAALLVLVTVLTARHRDPKLWPPPPGMPLVDIAVVSHGHHTGIAFSQQVLADIASRNGHAALIAITQRFASYPWIEIGWGGEEFYRNVPDTASLTVGLALRALFRPGNASVLHVVGLRDNPRAVFPVAEIVAVTLSAEGFARLVTALDRAFVRGPDNVLPEPLGVGLYGPSLFFPATDSFHMFNVCNHWVARLLSAGGLPTTPVFATFARGLLLDLKWRAGLTPLPFARETAS